MLDANVTTLIAALFLFQFGTGPIRGFAVTLSIGILASLFTAIFVSRWLFDMVLIPRLSLPWTKTEKMPTTRNTAETTTKTRRYRMKSIWVSRKNSMPCSWGGPVVRSRSTGGSPP